MDQQVLLQDDIKRIVADHLKRNEIFQFDENLIFQLIQIFLQNTRISLHQLTDNDYHKLYDQISLFTLQELHKLTFEDMTAKPDFALGAVGAKIIDYTGKWAIHQFVNSLSDFFESSAKNDFHYQSNSPAVILDGYNEAGRCWAFHGSNAFVTIQLSTTIYPDSITLDHISPKIAHDPNLSSTPKNFRVFVCFFLFSFLSIRISLFFNRV